jgi:molybdate transport system substrate-binding protein
VAGNFAAPYAELERVFETSSGIEVEASIGSTGQLYSQILNGAPFDVFLAADTLRPRLLEDEGFAVSGTRITYAIGRLVLFAPSWDSVRSGDVELRSREIQNLAIANPHTAPYGAAAIEVLQNLEIEHEFADRIVRGENVGQAFQFVESGAAEAGFIALSQVIGREPRSYWIVSDELHRPIRQDAVLILRREVNPAARSYLDFLRSREAERLISGFGYSIAQEDR